MYKVKAVRNGQPFLFLKCLHKRIHLLRMGLQALQELELCLGADQVMLRAVDLVIGIAIQIVGQETYRLHIGQ